MATAYYPTDEENNHDFKSAGSISNFHMKLHHLLGKGKKHLPDRRHIWLTNRYN